MEKEAPRALSKWGVLYVWERAINADLEKKCMEFDKLICVKKWYTTEFVYSGFFTVKDKTQTQKQKRPKKLTFGQYLVYFSPTGKIQKRILMLWTEEGIEILRGFRKSDMLCDNRDDFPWI